MCHPYGAHPSRRNGKECQIALDVPSQRNKWFKRGYPSLESDPDPFAYSKKTSCLSVGTIETISCISDFDDCSCCSLTATIKKKSRRKKVSFDQVRIRHYPIIMGDNPSVSQGAPISMGWSYEELLSLDLDDFEESKHCRYRRRERRERRCYQFCRTENSNRTQHMILGYYRRQSLLLRLGYSVQEQEEAARQILKIQRQRFQSYKFSSVSLSFFKLQSFIFSCKQKLSKNTL